MAERSFKSEVDKLRLGDGAELSGEGIVAVTKALLESGVGYVGGYQGAPVSHLLDVLADSRELLDELGVHFEASTSEATAAAMTSISASYPIRGAVAWKSVVGTNVASDALSTLASGGVKGGVVVVLGEDYGEGASIVQERSHAFAMKSQMWLLDPRPDLQKIVDTVKLGFELSEASNTPVFLMLRIRACHVYGRFRASDNLAPALTVKQAMETPQRDPRFYTIPPNTFDQANLKAGVRTDAAKAFIRDRKLNEVFDGDVDNLGIIIQGGLYNNCLRALNILGLADIAGSSQIPILVLNVTYPLVEDEILAYVEGKKAVLLIEEGYPEFIEHELNGVLRKGEVDTSVYGKTVLPKANEYTTEVLIEGIRKFIQSEAPGLLRSTDKVPVMPGSEKSALAAHVPGRPPTLCTGCPERPVFTAMKMLQKELGGYHVSADVGCNAFVLLPPFNMGQGSMGYGLGAASASGLNMPADKRTVSIIGDGGFWHNGLTSGVANAVFNNNDNVIIIIDNGYSAATGGQVLPSSASGNAKLSTGHPIVEAVKGVGVKWVRSVRTYDLETMRSTLHQAMTTKQKGPKVIVAWSECMLNRQRRERPKVAKALKDKKRVVRQRFGIDAKVCTGDQSCIRLSGCPSLTIAPNPDPLRNDPITQVLDSCVGCGHCGDVAHAAKLCPSFYRADIISNPTTWDRFKGRFRRVVIKWLQRRAHRRVDRYLGPVPVTSQARQ